MTIHDKCNYKNISNIVSHVKDKYNIIGLQIINIISFPRLRGDLHRVKIHRDMNRVKTYREGYSSFRNCKIVVNNNDYSIYNSIKNTWKFKNSIHIITETHIYPINEHVKIQPKLFDYVVIKIKGF